VIRSHHAELLKAARLDELSLRILAPSGRSPNPRVQRTRPYASLRGSPLTRHPLGGRSMIPIYSYRVRPDPP